MTKAELIEKMATDTKITKAVAGAVLASLIDGVTKGRNPKTGEAIKIKASTVVRFKAGKKLKDAV